MPLPPSFSQADFCFVLLDAGARCLLAARSAGDAPPLAWGSAPDGALLFASDPVALRGLCDRPAGGAALFPAGCYYRAADDDTAPQLVGCAPLFFFVRRRRPPRAE